MLPIPLLFKYKPEERLKQKATYHPAMPFELKRPLRETDPAVIVDYVWLLTFFVLILFAAIIILIPM